MSVSSRTILACALVLVQLGAAHGHVWHHAMTDHVSDGSTACAHAPCGCCCETSPADTRSHAPHDCEDCAVCSKSETHLTRSTHAQRLVEATLIAYAHVQVLSPPSSPAISPFEADKGPSPSPEPLNAITLPLLD